VLGLAAPRRMRRVSLVVSRTRKPVHLSSEVSRSSVARAAVRCAGPPSCGCAIVSTPSLCPLRSGFVAATRRATFWSVNDFSTNSARFELNQLPSNSPIEMIIGDWYLDDLGHPTREIRRRNGWFFKLYRVAVSSVRWRNGYPNVQSG
jgi:hypothetical protein